MPKLKSFPNSGTRKNILGKVKWLRVVLDEGHTIRNPNAQMTKAILGLQTQRKWVLTGTPIQNSLRDLWTLVLFLKIDPFTARDIWQRAIERPLSGGSEYALKRVQHLMGHIALRRMKTQVVGGKPLVQLPARNVYLETLQLSEDERRTYDTMAQEGKLIISRYFRQGTLLHHYGEVLAILMRLRQLCCHPFLIANAAKLAVQSQELSGQMDSSLPAELREKLVQSLLQVLNSGSDEECSICLDPLNTPVITRCVHVFCKPCIERVIQTEGEGANCPLCRGKLERNELIPVPENTEEEEFTIEGPWQSSAKVDALMKALIQQRKDDPTIKSIVVSQFTSFLTVLETPLKAAGFKFARLDGTMTAAKRTQAIEQFSDLDPRAPTIFLLSLKAGGMGLNLTAASRVFLMDPTWNPASEEQCFDRCHRLGQTKDVIITKYVVKDSVEELMLELQERKRKLMQGAFGKKQTVEQRRETRIADIKTLFS
ncbi:helicase-like transcription factor [Lingula anatina]|uniref:Helicase-like transcription factor n=1 Tax=Lingula anatina TaxID=7574 RepID=A0A2R2MPZ1_LINAN|nr:helicase-like transcription factor [Lingula anatina]|eukprot:XP_023932310.1 helicase-like transcription factor [Lingula anatina]